MTGSHEQADAQAAWLTVEVARRASLPAWLTGALDRARRRSTESQLPVAVLHAAAEQHGEGLVVMRLRDFVAWHGELPEGARRRR
jgi:hypothetical protein